MIFRTSGCTNHGHPEITVVFSREPVTTSAAGWILDHFQEMVASGVHLEPGDAVRIGFRTVRIIARDDGTLGVHERVDDNVWEEHVDRAMTDLWYQGEAAAKLRVPEELSGVRDDDYAMLQSCALGASAVILNRVEPESPDSFAWMVRCDDEHEHAEWVLTELFHITLALPHLSQFFALPVGVGVGVSREPASRGGGALADVVYHNELLTPDGGMHFGPKGVGRMTAGSAHAAAVKLDQDQYRTSIGAHHGHPDITIRVAEPLAEGLRVPLAQWLLDYLQDSMAEGRRFLPGQTIGIGWRSLRIVERPDGLGLLERDGDEWDEQVGRTLRDLWYQREVVSSVGLDEAMSFPADGQSAAMAECVAGSPSAVLLRRSPPDAPAASGWTVSCARDHDHGGGTVRALADLVDELPFAMQFLALPVGTSVEVQAPTGTSSGRIGVQIRIDGRAAQPLPGSYLAALAS